MAVGHAVHSFVLRFHEIGYDDELEKRVWRIKVSHVQGENEVTVRSMDEVITFMNRILEGE